MVGQQAGPFDANSRLNVASVAPLRAPREKNLSQRCNERDVLDLEMVGQQAGPFFMQTPI
jgi:hypothetical protein